jgi:hypothetical protein
MASKQLPAARFRKSASFCASPLFVGNVVVYWHGKGDNVIAFHPDCAARLAVHLCHDAVAAKHHRKGKPLPFGSHWP